tara:strand:+ start:1257 stop:1775 length:519 start_codon:yes stop_codon:yes gene_type:complete
MSEENTQAMTETVSESPATETTQPSSNEQYIAESKKYRKRAQDAEARIIELEKKFAQQEEAKLKEKEDFKALYEKVSSENQSLSANAEKWSSYENNRRASLLESHPEEDRESLSKIDLETLEYITNKIKNVKPNAPEVVGRARESVIKKPLSEMSNDEKAANWQNILKSYKK